MYQSIQLTNLIPSVRTSLNRSPWRRAFFLIPLALALGWLALSPTARAVDPPPDGGYPNFNTAEGEDALFSLDTSRGAYNTAMGFEALFGNTTGGGNTATGTEALFSNTTGGGNTATGFNALFSNTTGLQNTANGVDALLNNTLGSHNTASGDFALYSNTSGDDNTADGHFALFHNITGPRNTATGHGALYGNKTGEANTASGFNALLHNTAGSGNIALGASAGSNTTGSNNIDIGNIGIRGESNRIRIGTLGNHTDTFIAGISGVTVAEGIAVIIDANGQLGTVTSSERYKDSIKPMENASEAILALQPVTFRYKHELDPKAIPQFGLVAEDVAKVNPDLVARDAQGKPYTVRYEAVNAMLLNEFLKEHRKVEEQQATITQVRATAAKQEATIAQQQREFQSAIAQQQKTVNALTASLKEQAAQIQKVSDRLEANKPALQMVADNQ